MWEASALVSKPFPMLPAVRLPSSWLQVLGPVRPVVAACIRHGSDRFGRHKVWRASVVKDRAQLPSGYARRRGFDLAREGLSEALFVDGRVSDVAVEVAIGAFRQAKRPVHVDAERGMGISAGQGISPPASRTPGRGATGQGREVEDRVFRRWSFRRMYGCARPAGTPDRSPIRQVTCPHLYDPDLPLLRSRQIAAQEKGRRG